MNEHVRSKPPRLFSFVRIVNKYTRCWYRLIGRHIACINAVVDKYDYLKITTEYKQHQVVDTHHLQVCYSFFS